MADPPILISSAQTRSFGEFLVKMEETKQQGRASPASNLRASRRPKFDLGTAVSLTRDSKDTLISLLWPFASLSLLFVVVVVVCCCLFFLLTMSKRSTETALSLLCLMGY